MGPAQAASSQRIDGAGTRRRQADHQRCYPYAAVGWPLARLPARTRSLHDDLQSVQSMGQARTLASDLRGLGQARQRFRGSVSGFYFDQSSSLCFRRKRGECSQAIGRSRGGRTTKIHALSDPLCRPVTFLLTPGQDADIAAAPAVLALAPAMDALLADKGYDGDGFRAEIIKIGAKPVIPSKSNRVVLHRFKKRAYKGRNVIERCFYRLKDFRRSPPDTISSPDTFSHPSILRLSSLIGLIESGP
jgi:transposase